MTSAPVASDTSRGGRPELSASKRALLDQRLKGGLRSPAGAELTIPRADRNGTAPLSFTQQRLWFIHLLDPTSPAYNVPMAARIRGALDRGALVQALDRVAARHEIICTVFPTQEGGPVQHITPRQTTALKIIELPSAESWQQAVEAEAKLPFSLEKGPLWRCTLFQLGEEDHVLLVNMHHIISDGWSFGIVFRELRQFYQECVGEADAQLPELTIQYADFACWQQRALTAAALEKPLTFWTEKLTGAPPAITFPLPGQPSSQPGKGKTLSRLVPSALAKGMEDLARRDGTSPFITLLAALNILVWRWTGQGDQVVGTVTAGRSKRQTEDLIGCFMNFLPLRTVLSGSETAGQVLSLVKESVIEAYAYQDCPFEKIVEAVNPARRPSRNPLYNVALLYQSFPREDLNTRSLTSELVEIDTHTALLDLRFLAEPTPQGLRLACEYDVDLFSEEVIENLLESYLGCLGNLLNTPAAQIASFPLHASLLHQRQSLPATRETQNFVVASNFTAEPLQESLQYWADALELPIKLDFAAYNQVFQELLNPGSILRQNKAGLNVLLIRVEDWLRDQPHLLNTDEGLDKLHLTSRELVDALMSAAVTTSTPFLVCLCPPSHRVGQDRTAASAVADIEAVLAANLQPVSGVYLLTHQQILRWYPVSDYSDVQSDLLGHVPYTPQFFTALGTSIARVFHALKRPPKKVIALDCDNTLWSGVCGEDGPEGLRFEPARQALQRFMINQQENGMLLCLCTKNNPEDLEAVFERCDGMLLKKTHIIASRVNWLPKSQNLKSLAAELKVGVDSFIFVDDNPTECAEVQANCAEVLSLQLPEDPARIPQFLDHIWAFDHLKVTEEDKKRAHSYHQNRAREQFHAEAASFADFIKGLKLQITIEEAKPDQIARISQLTQRTNQFNFSTRRRTEQEIAQLISDPAAKVWAVTVTDRFGDYGLVGVMIAAFGADRLTLDTMLLSCRVLGKGVEHRMLAHVGEAAVARNLGIVEIPFVQSAKNKPARSFLDLVASNHRRERDDGFICELPADVVAATSFDPGKLGEIAAVADDKEEKKPASGPSMQSVADYSKIGWIAQNGADLLAIHDRIGSSEVKGRSEDYLAPRTDLEKTLCRIWQEQLRVERVGITDDFFKLGGTSLLAVRLFAEMERATGKELPLVALFQAPTVQQLAAMLERQSSSHSIAALVPIQPKGTKPPLILIHGAGGGILWGYTNLAKYLGLDQPVYAIEPRDHEGQLASVEAMAAHYLKEIRGLQPEGPYYLGGYCFGGYVAYEIARQLEAEGQRVAFLGLLDSTAPNVGYETVTWWNPGFLPRFLRNLFYCSADFAKQKPEVRREVVHRKLGVLMRKIKGLFGRKDASETVDLEEYINTAGFPEDELRLWQVHLKAGTNYHPLAYGGRVHLFCTRRQPFVCSFDPQYGWGSLARGGVDVTVVPGSHEAIFIEPDVRILAVHLTKGLSARS